jgi:hypothetical protein
LPGRRSRRTESGRSECGPEWQQLLQYGGDIVNQNDYKVPLAHLPHCSRNRLTFAEYRLDPVGEDSRLTQPHFNSPDDLAVAASPEVLVFLEDDVIEPGAAPADLTQGWAASLCRGR